MNFEINPTFLIKPFFQHGKDKKLNILKTKKIFQKYFLSFLKGPSLKEIKQSFLEDESPTLRRLLVT